MYRYKKMEKFKIEQVLNTHWKNTIYVPLYSEREDLSVLSIYAQLCLLINDYRIHSLEKLDLSSPYGISVCGWYQYLCACTIKYSHLLRRYSPGSEFV